MHASMLAPVLLVGVLVHLLGCLAGWVRQLQGALGAAEEQLPPGGIRGQLLVVLIVRLGLAGPQCGVPQLLQLQRRWR
jgi:hypothetical protein